MAHSLDNITRDMQSTDRIRFFMSSDKIGNVVNLPLMEVRAFGDGNSAANPIVNIVQSIQNSKKSFDGDDSLQINIQHVQMPWGAGKTSREKVWIELEKILRNKKCIIRILDKGNICCACAIVTAKARLDNDSFYESIHKGNKNHHTIQGRLAVQLRDANVSLGPCGLEEIKKFESHLKDYQMVVVSFEQLFTTVQGKINLTGHYYISLCTVTYIITLYIYIYIYIIYIYIYIYIYIKLFKKVPGFKSISSI